VSRAGPRWPPCWELIPREDSVEALEDGGYVAKVSLVRMADGAVISSASSELRNGRTDMGRSSSLRPAVHGCHPRHRQSARLAFSWSWRWPDSKRRPPRKCLQIAMSPRMRTRCRLANIGARNGQISEMTISVGLSRRTKPLPLSRWALRRNSTVVSLSMTRASRTNMARLHLKRVLTGFVPADEPSLTLLRKYKVGEVLSRRCGEAAQLPTPQADHGAAQSDLENLPEKYSRSYASFNQFRYAVAMASGTAKSYVSLEGEICTMPKA